jgi:hypothetical protein
MRAPAPATHSGRETDLSQAVYAIAAAIFITSLWCIPGWDAGAQEFLTGGVVRKRIASEPPPSPTRFDAETTQENGTGPVAAASGEQPTQPN